jgi:putative phosphoribosyl transferase
VAYEVARCLDRPFDVFVLRTLRVPGHEELTLGGIAAGGVRVLDPSMVAALGIPHGTIDDAARREALELARLEQYYRARRQGPKITGRAVALIDDGISRASILRTAIAALSVYRPTRIIVGLPVAPPDVIDRIDPSVDVVCAAPPEPLKDASQWYEDASPVSDREIRQLLAEAAEARHPPVERRAS